MDEQEIVICDEYGRKSTEDKARSVPGQFEDCDLAIERQSTPWRIWQVGERYVDKEISASRFTDKIRPGFEELFADYRRYKPAPGVRRALALWECSRGSRQISEWSAFIELLRDRRILVLTAEDGRVYDPTDRRDFRRLIEEGMDAHDESERTSERCQRGQRAAARAGRPQGKRVYGYRREYDDSGLFVRQVEHETQAPVVAEIFERVERGDALHEIARDLNGRKVPPPAGKAWYLSAVRRIALRTSYLGVRVHLGAVVAEGCWPALVDREKFDACAAILGDPKRRTANHHSLRHPLSGLIACPLDDCDGTLHARWQITSKTNPLRRRLYQCRACGKLSIAADTLDQYVIAAVHTRLRSPEGVGLFEPPSRDAEIQAAEAQEKVLKGRLAELYQAARKGAVSATGAGEIEAGLLADLEAVRAKIKATPSQFPPLLHGLTPASILADWDSLSVTRQRAVVAFYCNLVIGPATPGRKGFDRSRLGLSRWRGDARTWGELWATSPEGSA